MEQIIIQKHQDGSFNVIQGDMMSGILTYEGVLGIISALIMPEDRPCLHWMRPRLDQFPSKPIETSDN